MDISEQEGKDQDERKEKESRESRRRAQRAGALSPLDCSVGIIYRRDTLSGGTSPRTLPLFLLFLLGEFLSF